MLSLVLEKLLFKNIEPSEIVVNETNISLNESNATISNYSVMPVMISDDVLRGPDWRTIRSVLLERNLIIYSGPVNGVRFRQVCISLL